MAYKTAYYFVITVGSGGDVHPFLRIGSALRALGRDVSFISYAYHADLVQRAGLPFVGIGTHDDFARTAANPDLWDPRKGFAALMASYREQLDQIVAAIRAAPAGAPRVAIVHPFAVPAAAIARELGLIDSVVGAWLAPSNLRSCCDPLVIGDLSIAPWVPISWRRALWNYAEKKWIDPVAIGQINPARAHLGLPPIDSLLTHIADSPDLSVTLFPSWFAPAVPDWPRRLIAGDFQLFEPPGHEGFTAALSDFLAAGDKPIVFTPGTANLHAADFFSCALAAVTRLGRRALFLTRERAQLPAELPATVLWQPYVPLSSLLPHAAVLVHHGGIGTTAEALRAGTPQLVTPFAWDQFDNGARIASLGAGRVIAAKRLRARTLARVLDTLASSEAVRSRCAEIARRFVPPHDPAVLCREIERQLNVARYAGAIVTGCTNPQNDAMISDAATAPAASPT